MEHGDKPIETATSKHGNVRLYLRVAALCLALAFQMLLTMPTATTYSDTTDFTAVYYGARCVLNRSTENLYDVLSQDADEGVYLLFAYHPVWAYLLSPLALLPYPLAVTVWWCFSLVMYAVTVFFAARYLALLGRDSALGVTSLSLVLYPFSANQALCQTNSLVAALITCFAFGIRRGRSLTYVLAGASLALACLMKGWPVLLLASCLCNLWVMGSAVMTTVLASMAVGPGLAIEWLRTMVEASRATYLHAAAPDNVSLNGILMMWDVPQLMRFVAMGLVWVFAVCFVVPRRRQLSAFGVLVLASLVSFPNVQIHWLSVVTVVLVARVSSGGIARATAALWVALTSLQYCSLWQSHLAVVLSCLLLPVPFALTIWSLRHEPTEEVLEAMGKNMAT